MVAVVIHGSYKNISDQESVDSEDHSYFLKYTVLSYPDGPIFSIVNPRKDQRLSQHL